jgi:hypothetical protein
MNRSVSVGLACLGFLNWYFPGFDGMLSGAARVSTGDGRIIGAIFMVGAAILWFTPRK